ncbi:hypothetical protein CTV95_06265 [Pectobacterium brasiliense]|nr:hypothetical protein CTV95_06265 [Pectobacterium brasiliense]MCH4990917.1 hypothetical protein [Pectobacterium brasiliense]
MTDRVILQRYFSELQNGLHESIVKYATDRAKNHKCEVFICVKNKSNCDQILERIFEKSVVKKLKSNNDITVNGQKLSLHSSKTIKKSYQPKAVYLLFFPGPDLLEAVEYQVGKSPVAEIIVFTEIDEHTEPTDAWMLEHDVRKLYTDTAI